MVATKIRAKTWAELGPAQPQLVFTVLSTFSVKLRSKLYNSIWLSESPQFNLDVS